MHNFYYWPSVHPYYVKLDNYMVTIGSQCINNSYYHPNFIAVGYDNDFDLSWFIKMGSAKPFYLDQFEQFKSYMNKL